MKRVIITHANCTDGFAAAWIARNYYKDHSQLGLENLEFLECHYQDPKNDGLEELIRGNHVEVFDFSFPRATMQWYDRIAASFRVWDHHATAKVDCEGLTCCTFDLKLSGAMLAWQHYYPGMEPPMFVQYVQDRDLWTWELACSREVSAYIQSWERTFDNFDIIGKKIENDLNATIEAGQTLLRQQDGAIKGLMKFQVPLIIGDHLVPCLNLTGLISETLERLAKGQPFAASFFINSEGAVVFSLRSESTGLDVGTIARIYGGGGHPHAAGFRIPVTQLNNILHTRDCKISEVSSGVCALGTKACIMKHGG